MRRHRHSVSLFRPLRIPTAGPPPFAPSQVPGLVLWLEASDLTSSPVQNWTDRSGLGNHATQPVPTNRPTWSPTAGPSGGPAVLFNGSNSFLSIPATAALVLADLSIFLRIKIRDISTGQYNMLATKTVGSGASTNDFELRVIEGRVQLLPNNHLEGGSSTALDTAWHRLTTIRAGTAITYRIDGSDAGGDVSYPLPNDTAQPVLLGTRADASFFAHADVARALVYARAVTAQERADIEAWI